jgi:hypothetical protein
VANIIPPDLEAAIRAAWALDTCDPVDADDWSAGLPTRGAQPYLTMRHRVLTTLGLPEADDTTHH